jgi:hypothetical protein
MSGQAPNRGSFQRGISGNPGGRPPSAEVSALARRYTADWLRGLVGVVRLPVCKENAPSIISAAVALRDTGYPGLTKSAGEAGSPSLHLHLLAVTREAQATLQALPQGAVLEPTVGLQGFGDWHEPEEPPLDASYVPPVDERLPHEALPLWDAAEQTPNEEGGGGADDSGAG